MKATVIVDNIKNGDIKGEWGLSLLIEYNGKIILLDTGASYLFADNASKLGLDLEDVDIAVLSHAHYDHANGFGKFFELNNKAKLYVRDCCAENCYGKKWIFHKYIGIPKGVFSKYKDRIEYVSGDYKICEGISLLSHKTEGLEKIGKRENLYQKKNRKLTPDDFSHEQSLVFDTEEGLVVFNSCSHAGVANIIKEVETVYPSKKVIAIIGGFHLFRRKDEEVRELAKQIKNTGIKYVYTGHCTGQRAYDVLKVELGDMVKQLKVGLEINIGER